MVVQPRTDRRMSVAVLAATLLATFLFAVPAAARVRLNLGIVGPPALVAIPASPVEYAPDLGADHFFYGGRYFVFADGIWYASSGYDGPWDIVDPAFVPGPILAVPIAYYRVVPRPWASWRRDRPPRWDLALRHRPDDFRHQGPEHGGGHQRELEHGRRG